MAPSQDASRPPATAVAGPPPVRGEQGTSAAKRRTIMSFIVTRGSFKRLGILFLLIAIGLFVLHWYMIRMPGTSFRGELPSTTEAQLEAAERIRSDVASLAGAIGQRSTYNAKSLAQAALELKRSLESIGYTVLDHSFPARGAASPNLQIQIDGTDPALASEIILCGAHYDAYQGTPGADDNASGVAAILELARRFHDHPQARTLRLVLFVNEEPPAFKTSDMGSRIYADKSKADGDRIIAMLSLESIGYYRTEAGSQDYPYPFQWFYPTTGDFIAIVGNLSSRSLVHRAVATFRASCKFPCEGLASPESIPGVGWSDHWAFWRTGFPAVMVTATAPFRNPNYHEASDTPDTLDYDRLSRVVDGLQLVIEELASRSE